MRGFYSQMQDAIATATGLVYVSDGESHAYAEMYDQMKKINSLLYKITQRRIAHFTSKKFSSYSAIFATVLSNNIWIPLTPEFPEQRNLEILNLAKPDMIFHDVALPNSLVQYARENNVRLIFLPQLLVEADSVDFQLASFLPDETAYIMFTSGSTGKPKGVPMTHANYINFVQNAMTLLPFRSHEVFSDYHDFAFDISIFYLFCCILNQGTFAPIIKAQDKIIPLDHIQRHKVTVWSSVPSVMLRIMKMYRDQNIQTPIHVMFLCGEPFRLDILKYCYEKMNLPHIYNFYGLTETGVENFYHTCCPEDVVRYQDFGFVPIGKPLPGNDVAIGDNDELLVSGCQVTPGYLGGIGSERFEIKNDKLWYHTGDMVTKFEDVYFCKGRMDTQIKLSGYRIDLMDIEANLRQISGVKDAICFVSDDGARPMIVAAIESQQKIKLQDVNQVLGEKLPSYMLPKNIFSIETMPVNNNGKIDRKTIKELYRQSL